jgi:hypothetical protein
MSLFRDFVDVAISKLIEYYYFNSRKLKTFFVCAVRGVLLLVVVIVLFGKFSPEEVPIREKLGLKPLSITDENGDKWVLDIIRGQPISRFQRLDAKFGPPLLVKTDVRIKRREVSIGLVVEGQAGEQYVGGVRKDGKWNPPPEFKIVNESGRILTTGVFKYG